MGQEYSCCVNRGASASNLESADCAHPNWASESSGTGPLLSFGQAVKTGSRRRRLEAITDYNRCAQRMKYEITDDDWDMIEEFWEECRSLHGSCQQAFSSVGVRQLGRVASGRVHRVSKKEFGEWANITQLVWLKMHHRHLFYLLDLDEDDFLTFEEFSGAQLKGLNGRVMSNMSLNSN
mmetsp:Transcript_10824/g.20155  ORF Transcript_10824/g.20155 Transcript_10824/m.20155 type:complete len:179 (-) Transcript_10824:27-563(-)